MTTASRCVFNALLGLLLALPMALPLELTLLHTNDMHSKFAEVTATGAECRMGQECLGGFARLAHVLGQHRALGARAALYLVAGDVYEGSNWFTVHGPQVAVEFMNLLAPDVVSLGNHEFDKGPSGLAPYVDGLHSPVVAANLDLSKVPSLHKVQKYAVLTVEGVKVGVIGYLTAETELISKPTNVTFLDEVTTLREISQQLDREGIKIIIALGHSGFTTDKLIAAEVPLVDVVIGGHTNTFLYNGLPPDSEEAEGPYPTVVTQSSGKKVPVVQAYAFTKYLGRLNVTFDDTGDLIRFEGQPIFMSHDIPQDQEVLDLLETYRPEIDALQTTVIGSTRVLLQGGNNVCRFKECTLGNVIADAYIAYVAQMVSSEFWSDVSIALVDSGCVRGDIDTSKTNGTIVKAALIEAIVADLDMFTCSLLGEDLLETLELAVRSNGETAKGEVLQFSGLRVVYDWSKPTGHRVVSAMARCGCCSIPVYEPIVANRTYNIVTTTFLIEGGAGHKALKEKHFNKHALNISEFDLLLWYFEKYSPLLTEIQGRVVFLGV